MANTTDTGFGLIEVFDDFLALGTADTEQWEASSDTGGSSGVVADGTAHLGGRWRLATDTDDNDMSEGPCSGLVFQVQDGGPLIAEYRVMIETGAANTVAINCGFNDDPTDASNTLPVELSTATFTSNAATFCGLVYDPDATNDDWHVFWVDDDADSGTAIASLRMDSSTPTVDKWVTLRTVLNDQGSGNGAYADFNVWDANTDPAKHFAKSFSTSVDRDAVLCAYMGMENRSGEAHNVDVDYIYVCAPRGTTA